MTESKFRVESYGSGVRNVEEVLFYEIYELGNLDALQTMLNLYLTDTYIEKEVVSLIYKLSTEPNTIDESYENYIRNIINKIIKIVNSKTNKNIKYALWLGEKDMVKKYYGYDGITDDDVYEYKTSSVILSNLDIYGKLYGYENNPICINKEN